jgi:hypothetical protein
MAVDVEPVVFWDGENPSPEELLKRWQRDVGFVSGDHPGAHGRVQARGNGPSGCKVRERYLKPLHETPAHVAFTDVYPMYMAKRGTRKRPEQWNAIEREFNPIAAPLGRSVAWLPPRLPPRRLIESAKAEFSQQLVADLRAAQPERVITLGNEAMKVVLDIQELDAQAGGPTLNALRAVNQYGVEGSLSLDGNRVPWLPLVHPGQLRTCQTPDLPTVKRSSPDPAWPWDLVHAWWQSTAVAH